MSAWAAVLDDVGERGGTPAQVAGAWALAVLVFQIGSRL